MCGRFSSLTPPEAMRRLFHLVEPVPAGPPRYNCAPSQDLAVVIATPAGRRLVPMRWGLIPAWSAGPGHGPCPINARAETVAEKPSFREAFRRRRCLVPADGFYEWRRDGRRKRPVRFTLSDGAPFAMAGIWEAWHGPDGTTIRSFAIIVTDANALVRPVHDRMPVILAPGDWAAWLDPGNPDPRPLLTAFAAEAMRAQPVSERVNSPRHDDPGCIAAAEAGEQAQPRLL